MRIKESTLNKLISKEINLLNEEAGVPTDYEMLAKFILTGLYSKIQANEDKMSRKMYTLRIEKEMYSFLDIKGRLAKTAPNGITIKAQRKNNNKGIRGYWNPVDSELFLTFVLTPGIPMSTFIHFNLGPIMHEITHAIDEIDINKVKYGAASLRQANSPLEFFTLDEVGKTLYLFCPTEMKAHTSSFYYGLMNIFAGETLEELEDKKLMQKDLDFLFGDEHEKGGTSRIDRDWEAASVIKNMEKGIEYIEYDTMRNYEKTMDKKILLSTVAAMLSFPEQIINTRKYGKLTNVGGEGDGKKVISSSKIQTGEDFEKVKYDMVRQLEKKLEWQKRRFQKAYYTALQKSIEIKKQELADEDSGDDEKNNELNETNKMRISKKILDRLIKEEVTYAAQNTSYNRICPYTPQLQAQNTTQQFQNTTQQAQNARQCKLYVKCVKATPTYTLSRLSVNGNYVCDVLEDTIRPLSVQNGKIVGKVDNETCIPAGTYNVYLTHKSKFVNYPNYQKAAHNSQNQALVPYIDNVNVNGITAFTGILIHQGRTIADTKGCLLVGKSNGNGTLTDCQSAYERLLSYLVKAKNNKQSIAITIDRNIA